MKTKENYSKDLAVIFSDNNADEQVIRVRMVQDQKGDEDEELEEDLLLKQHWSCRRCGRVSLGNNKKGKESLPCRGPPTSSRATSSSPSSACISPQMLMNQPPSGTQESIMMYHRTITRRTSSKYLELGLRFCPERDLKRGTRCFSHQDDLNHAYCTASGRTITFQRSFSTRYASRLNNPFPSPPLRARGTHQQALCEPFQIVKICLLPMRKTPKRWESLVMRESLAI